MVDVKRDGRLVSVRSVSSVGVDRDVFTVIFRAEAQEDKCREATKEERQFYFGFKKIDGTSRSIVPARQEFGRENSKKNDVNPVGVTGKIGNLYSSQNE